MVQVIQTSDRGLRARALAQNQDQIAQGLIGLVASGAAKEQKDAEAEKQGAMTKRQMALQNLSAVQNLRNAGYDVTPEQFAQATGQAPIYEGEVLPDLFGKRTPEYMQKQQKALLAEQSAKEDKELDRKFKRAQIKKMESESNKLVSESRGAGGATQKLSKMSAEAQGKVAGIASALDALGGMEQAILSGSGPERITASTPLIGGFVSDTPYTQNERLVAEVVGRLQSGGAISEPELQTFKNLGPRAGDSPEIQQSKLAQQKSFLQNKLIGFGIKPDELGPIGFTQTSKPKSNVALSGIGGQFNPSKKAPGVIPQAQASTVKPQHQEAVKRMSDEDLMKYLGIR